MLASQRALRDRFQRLVVALASKPIFWFAFIVTMFSWPILRSIRAERDLQRNLPVYGLVRDFTLREQHGGELGAAELRGRLWVANFITIECEPPCAELQRVMKEMGQLRHRTRNLGDVIRLVTFVVDADRDAPDVLSELSATYRAGHGSWRFVSGPLARVEDVLRDFQAPGGLPQTRLALVGGNMLIRGYYDLTDEAALSVLLRDISALLSLGG